MTAETAIFTCSICSEPSSQICVYCTKDVCGNHRCDRCKRCSDCCGCDLPLSAAEPEPVHPPEAEAPPPAFVEPAVEQNVVFVEPSTPETHSEHGFDEGIIP